MENFKRGFRFIKMPFDITTIFHPEIRKIFFQSSHSWLITIMLIWLAINLPFVNTYPAPTGDEVQVAAVSVELIEHGRLGIPIWGDIAGSAHHFSIWQMYNVLLAVFFRIFGIGLTQLRLFSLIGALVSGLLIYKVGEQLYSAPIGILAAMFYLYSWRIFWIGHLGRPETWVIAGGLTAILVCWHAIKSHKISLAFVAGLLSALIVNIYITNIYNSLAISALAAWHWRERPNWNLLLWFVLGGLVGVIYWIAAHLLPYPTLYMQQFTIWFLNLGRAEGNAIDNLLSRLSYLPSILKGGFFDSSRLGPLESVYFLMGIGGLLVRRKIADTFVLTILLTLSFGFLFIVYSSPHHIVDIMPMFCLATASAVSHGADWLSTRSSFFRNYSPSIFSALIVAPLLLGYIAGSVALGWQNKIIDYETYASKLNSLVPANSNILSEATWWWALRGGIYTADEYLLFKDIVPEDQPKRLYAILQERKVQVILVDENLSYIYREHNRPDIYDALVSFAQTQCNLAGTVEGYAYGVEQGGPAIKRTKVYLCPTRRWCMKTENKKIRL